jgi:hypothetical protein
MGADPPERIMASQMSSIEKITHWAKHIAHIATDAANYALQAEKPALKADRPARGGKRPSDLRAGVVSGTPRGASRKRNDPNVH